MTTITLPRAVVEQALRNLEFFRDTAICAADTDTANEAITALRAALAQEQAEPVQEPHRDLRAALQTPGCERLREWVEIGPVQRAALETFVETFALAEPPGCDHCRHPLYAATKCRVCGRVTEQAEPALQTCNCRWDGDVQVQQCTLHEAHVDAIHEWAERAKTAEKKLAALAQEQAEPVQEPAAYIHRQGNHWEVSERHLDEDEKDRGWTEEPLYTTPPQRKPLTDDEIRDLWSWSMTAEAERTGTTQQHAFARAIERAHGIGGQDE